MSVYLCLYHGRKTPTEHMDDWGTVGPAIGPLETVSVTYGSTVKIDAGFAGGSLIQMIEGCVPFDGVLYGDFAVSVDPKKHEIVPLADALRRIDRDNAPGGYVETCQAAVPPQKLDGLSKCDDRGCLGWCHMNEGTPEQSVQACDCGTYATDEAAVAAHNRECVDGSDCRFITGEES